MRFDGAVICSCVLLHASWVGAQPEQAHVGLGLELPLATAFWFGGEPRSQDGTWEHIDQSGVHLGPVVHDDDFGAQVPALLNLGVPVYRGFMLGVRFGAAATCLDGSEWGEQGPDFNTEVQPYAEYQFPFASRVRPFVAGGLLRAHSCVGDTEDAATSTLSGMHLGAGANLLVNEWLSGYGELRVLDGWGQHRYYSHGETALRWDGSDLRVRLLIGVMAWL